MTWLGPFSVVGDRVHAAVGRCSSIQQHGSHGVSHLNTMIFRPKIYGLVQKGLATWKSAIRINAGVEEDAECFGAAVYDGGSGSRCAVSGDMVWIRP